MHTTRETTFEVGADTFGARLAARLRRADLTPLTLDTMRAKAEVRVGAVLAPFATQALAADVKVQKPLAYMQSLSDDELRLIAENERVAQDRPRPTPESVPTKCDSCGPNRRLEDPADGRDLGPCPTCHPNRVKVAS